MRIIAERETPRGRFSFYAVDRRKVREQWQWRLAAARFLFSSLISAIGYTMIESDEIRVMAYLFDFVKTAPTQRILLRKSASDAMVLLDFFERLLYNVFVFKMIDSLI